MKTFFPVEKWGLLHFHHDAYSHHFFLTCLTGWMFVVGQAHLEDCYSAREVKEQKCSLHAFMHLFSLRPARDYFRGIAVSHDACCYVCLNGIEVWDHQDNRSMGERIPAGFLHCIRVSWMGMRICTAKVGYKQFTYLVCRHVVFYE